MNRAAQLLEVILQATTRRCGSVLHVEIRHDDDCGYWKARPCDCDPEVVPRENEGSAS